jgi:DNA-binding LacI/PurR family transcriptional regulator
LRSTLGEGDHVAERGAKRRITTTDIARSLGISRATVGFVLNETPGQTISDATRQRVLEEAARLGYRPHVAAQALASGRSRIILLVLPDWPIEHSMRLALEEASNTLDQAGYSLVTYTRHDGGQARPLWEILSPDVVIGYSPFSDSDIASMHACGISKIIPEPGRKYDFSQTPTISTGPQLQVQYLHSLGHQRLAFAAPADPRVAELRQARAQSAQHTAKTLGLPPMDEQSVSHQDDSAHHAVQAWHSRRITAVAAYNDDVAATVINAAIRQGLAVPQQLAVIGHDDSPICAVFLPSISSVRIDNPGLGRYLANIALHSADGRQLAAEVPNINAHTVIRESA